MNIGRERHSFSGGLHCFTIEIFFLAQPGRRGWELIVAKEHWWNAGHQRPLKTLRWSQLTIGSRKDIMAWLREREREIERRTSTS